MRRTRERTRGEEIRFGILEIMMVVGHSIVCMYKDDAVRAKKSTIRRSINAFAHQDRMF